jgi:hypothetical protein
MDFFGWLLERRNPGPTGSVETHYNGRVRTHLSIIAGGMASLTAVILPFYFIVDNNGFSWQTLGIYAVFGIIYLLISYRLNPVADSRNMGIFGFINNPFKYTDDINRFLIFFKIFLYPGRLIGIGLVDFWELISAGTKP